MIRHIVMWRLATDDPELKRAQVAEMAQRFEALVGVIDGTERIEVRADLGETDGNWDVVLDADYRDRAALAHYQAHPAHVEIVGFVRSIAAARACVDWELP